MQVQVAPPTPAAASPAPSMLPNADKFRLDMGHGLLPLLVGPPRHSGFLHSLQTTVVLAFLSTCISGVRPD